MKFSIFLAIFGFLSILLPGVRSASCESDETLVNVITYHGYWLSENSWEIYDEDDDPVDGCSGSDYSYDICSWEYAELIYDEDEEYSSSSSYVYSYGYFCVISEECCIPEGEFTFTAFDSYGDAWNYYFPVSYLASGMFEVEDQYGVEILAKTRFSIYDSDDGFSLDAAFSIASSSTVCHRNYIDYNDGGDLEEAVYSDRLLEDETLGTSSSSGSFVYVGGMNTTSCWFNISINRDSTGLPYPGVEGTFDSLSLHSDVTLTLYSSDPEDVRIWDQNNATSSSTAFFPTLISKGNFSLLLSSPSGATSTEIIISATFTGYYCPDPACSHQGSCQKGVCDCDSGWDGVDCATPSAWVSDTGYYNSSDYCDCAAGVYDPDCNSLVSDDVTISSIVQECSLPPLNGSFDQDIGYTAGVCSFCPLPSSLPQYDPSNVDVVAEIDEDDVEYPSYLALYCDITATCNETSSPLVSNGNSYCDSDSGVCVAGDVTSNGFNLASSSSSSSTPHKMCYSHSDCPILSFCNHDNSFCEGISATHFVDKREGYRTYAPTMIQSSSNGVHGVSIFTASTGFIGFGTRGVNEGSNFNDSWVVDSLIVIDATFTDFCSSTYCDISLEINIESTDQIGGSRFDDDDDTGGGR